MTAEQRRLYQRPLARAWALVESWADDPTPITRAQAADELARLLDPRGWTETDASVPHLAAVPTIDPNQPTQEATDA